MSTVLASAQLCSQAPLDVTEAGSYLDSLGSWAPYVNAYRLAVPNLG